tara:strand:- start:116 stop:337 length:222 start_codon:yes stop_codon:yes gene_type:complete
MIKTLILSILLGGCALIDPYKPMQVNCSLDKVKVLEYTRVCVNESMNSWQSCAAQAERLFCSHPVWRDKNDKH